MTMLDRMRRHKGWLKWSLALVILAFVGLYASDFANTGNAISPTTGALASEVVAEVDGREITAGEFTQRYLGQIQSYQTAYGGSVSEELLRQLGIDQQILQQMVDEQAALTEAERQGIRVSDEELAQQILAIPGLQENGLELPPLAPAPQQPDEVAAAALGVLDHAQAFADEGADDGLGRRRPPGGFQGVERGDACRVHRVEAPAEHGFDQRILGAEVIVHRGEVHARLGRELAHRGALEAVEHEQLLGGIEDAGAGFVLGLHGAQGHGRYSVVKAAFKRTFEW